MIEVLVILLLTFAVITCLGHGIWLLLAAVFRALFGGEPPHTQGSADQPSFENPPASKRPVLEDDLAALRRLVPYFRNQGLIDDLEAEQLTRLAKLTVSNTSRIPQASPETQPQPHPLDPLPSGPVTPATPTPVPLMATLVHDHRLPQSQSSPPQTSPPQTSLTNPLAPQAQLLASQVSSPQVIRPRQALSEILQSFLAAHNIRWGEITAGILIVVCSIGLVTSLWSTLAEANRLIPAAIFLLAVAGIETAGLYTLSRWKLRHTSRAVLVIATMLIPLSMMAGISIAGRGDAAVSLSRMSTWLAIIASWITTGVMIFLAGRALVGQGRAVHWTLGIGLPTFILPTIPGLVRMFGQHSIWIAAVATLTVFIFLLRDATRIADRASRKILSAKYQHLVLHHGLAIYSLCMLAAMLMLRLGRNVDVFAPLSLTVVPILLAVFGIAICIKATPLTSGRRLQISSSYLVTGLLILVLVPLMMTNPLWLAGWGLLVAASSVATGLLTKNRTILAWCSIALAVSLPPLLTLWLGSIAWDTSFPLWQRYISSYGALVMLGTGWLTLATGSWMNFKSQLGTVLVLLGVFIAAAVGLGPSAWLIGVPRSLMTIVIFVAAGCLAISLRRHQHVATITSLPTIFAWASLLLAGDNWWDDSYQIWLPALVKVLLATAITIAVIGEAIRLTTFANLPPVSKLRSAGRWWRHVAVFALLAGTLSLFFLPFSTSLTAGGTLCAAAILTVAAVRGGLPNWIVVAQVALLTAATSLVYSLKPQWIQFDQPANTLLACYTLLAIFSLCTATWLIAMRLVAGGKRHALTIAVRRDRMQFPLQFAQLLIWSFLGLLTFQLANLLAAHTTEELTRISVPTGFIVAAASAAAVLIFSLRPSRDLPAYLLALLVPVTLLGLRLAPESKIELSIVGWTSLLVSIGLLASLWYRGRSTVDVPARTRLLETTYIMVLALLALVLASTGSILLGPDWHPLFTRDQTTQQPMTRQWGWLTNSILLWPVLLSLITAILGRLTKDTGITSLAVAITVLAAPACLLITSDDARLLEFVMAATCGCFVPYFAIRLSRLSGIQVILEKLSWESQVVPRPDSQLAFPATLASYLGIAITACTSASWTIHYWLRTELDLFELFGSPHLWLGLFLIAALIFFFQLGKPYLESLALRVMTIFSVGAGLVTASLVDLQWIPATSNPLVSSHNLVAWIWLAIAIAGFVHAYINKQTSTAIFSVGLILLVNLFGPFALIDRVEVTWLWGIAALALNIAGLFSHGRLGWFKSGQILGVSGLASTCLLLTMNKWTGSALISGLLLVLTAAAIAWSSQALWLRRNAKPYTKDPGIVGFLSIIGCLISTVIAVEVFRFGPPAFGTPQMLSVAASVFALAAAVVSFGLAPHRFNAAPIVFISTQAMSLLLIGCVARYLPTANASSLACVTAVVVAGLWAWAWPLLSRLLYRAEQLSHHQFRLTVTVVLLGLLVFSVCSVTLFWENEQTSRSFLIAAVLGMAFVIGAISGWSDRTASNGSRQAGRSQVPSLETYAVFMFAAGLTLGALGLNPVVGPWGLVSMMRLLLAAAIFTPSMLWIARRVFGLGGAGWQQALHRGSLLGIGLALVSLLGMFGCELMLWGNPVIREVPLPLVVGIAVLLGLSSLALAVCGVFPNSLQASIGQPSDNLRTLMIFAAQALGGLTWLHLFLVRSELALIGLRPYWPYIVMLLAFASAGLTQFARTRKDEVLENAMRKSTFLLPLIPVIGFWLTFAPDSWMYLGQRSSYSVVLVIGAVFYGALALTWQAQRIPRVLGILLGNGALWVMLVQTPNLSFFSHPQLWLIPPAACVLLATYLEKQNLPANVLTTVRYASLLVIYVSSTADIMLDQIGANFWDPIILILLALVGMIVGVVARTRAFLYLGSLFVFVGVLSMVWQAGRAIDQSWPWWVFGITMGLIMLATLMFLEKNRAILKKFAGELATWQG